MAATDTVNRVLREFRRYTGDGLPGEPVNAPLPVGDPQSGVHNPKKAELREGMIATIEGGGEAAQAVINANLPVILEARDEAAQSATLAGQEADRADDAADRAQNAASSVTSRAWFESVSALVNDTSVIGYAGSGADFVVASGDTIEAGQFRYSVTAIGASDLWLIETQGGVKLYPIVTYSSGLVPEQYGAPANGVDLDIDAIDKAVAHAGHIYTTFGYPYTPPLVWFSGSRYLINRPIHTEWPIRFDGANARIEAVVGFTGKTIPLAAGGTEVVSAVFIFLNGDKGTYVGTLRWSAELGRGLILSCDDKSNMGVYIERMPYSRINCEVQHSILDAVQVGPYCWGVNLDNIIIENAGVHGIHFLKDSAANGASIRNPRIWGEFKESQAGIRFAFDAACHGVLIDGGFIEKLTYGVLVAENNGPINVTGIDFEQIRYNAIHAEGDNGAKLIGPVVVESCYLASSEAAKIYARNAVVEVRNSQLFDYPGTPTADFEALEGGLIRAYGNKYGSSVPTIVAGSKVIGMDLVFNGVQPVVRPISDVTNDLGDMQHRWRRIWAGNLSLFPAPSVTPANPGELMFQVDSNTQISLKLRGADNVVRSVLLTLT